MKSLTIVAMASIISLFIGLKIGYKIGERQGLRTVNETWEQILIGFKYAGVSPEGDFFLYSPDEVFHILEDERLDNN